MRDLLADAQHVFNDAHFNLLVREEVESVGDAVIEDIVHGALLIGGIVFEVNNNKTTTTHSESNVFVQAQREARKVLNVARAKRR